jgi:biopolymer transport protein ExbD
MAMSGGSDNGDPMMDMNMTPLIDVLLVLLIVFIMSIPIATNAINIDLPVAVPPPDVPLPDPVINKVVLTPTNQILWNGNPVNTNELVFQLQQTLTYSVEPELQFEPEAQASYELSANVLNIIKASGVTKFGFVGNERYRQFDAGAAVGG